MRKYQGQGDREKGEMCTRVFLRGFYGKDLAKQGNKYVQDCLLLSNFSRHWGIGTVPSFWNLASAIRGCEWWPESESP